MRVSNGYPLGQSTAGPARRLVGRAADLHVACGLLDRATVAGAQVLFLEGEPGIGKTALVAAVMEAARVRGFHMLFAGADELGGRRSFGLVTDALGRIGVEPRRPGHPGDAPGLEPPIDLGDQAFQVSEDAIGALDILCATGPALLVLEDLHWADASSLYVIRRLIRHVASLPLAVFATLRPVPQPAELAALLGEVGERRHKVLGPLGAAAMDRLVTEALGARPGPHLRAQVALTGGNPLMALEVLDALRAEGALRPAARRAKGGATLDVDPNVPPPSLQRAVLERAQILGPDVLHLLELAAVLGVRFRPVHLALLSRRPIADLVAPLETAVAAGLLAEAGEDLVFRHELVRETLVSRLAGPVLSSLHWDAAQVLADVGVPASLVAEHLLRSAGQVGELAVARLHSVARQVIETSPGTAADLLERALELADRPGAATADLVADLAMALLWSGRSVEGEAACRRCLAEATDPSVRGALSRALAASWLHRGRANQVLEFVAQCRDDPRLAVGDRAWLEGLGANARLFVGPLDDALARARHLEEVARSLGYVALEARALSVEALAELQGGRAIAAIATGERAVALAERTGSRDVNDAHPHLALAMALIDTDRFTEAADVLRRGRAAHERLGVRGALPMHDVALGYVHFWSGNWDAAAAEIETGIALAEETGAGWRVAARGLRSVIALAQGDRLTAERWLRAGAGELAAGEVGYRVEWWRWAILLYRGDSDDDAADPAWASDDAVGIPGQDLLVLAAIAPTVVAAAIRRGQAALAAEVAAALVRLEATTTGVGGVRAARLAVSGLIQQDVAALERAVDLYRQAGRPFERALVCEQAALLSAQRGDGARARTFAKEALEVYARLDAPAFAMRLVRRLWTHGVRAADGTVPALRPTQGWGALTAAEHRVLRLVAERRSNPDIARALSVSRRTVETHVSNMLGKLGLSSRGELAAAAAARFGWRLRLEDPDEGAGPR